MPSHTPMNLNNFHSLRVLTKLVRIMARLIIDSTVKKLKISERLLSQRDQ
jgi:hypothetical protein